MRNTSFAVTFSATVEAHNRTWNLTCTASPQGWDSEPALLWCENNDPECYFVPTMVWEAVEDQLLTNGPARIAYDAAMAKADVPFMVAAE
jgi:hypothetical protein